MLSLERTMNSLTVKRYQTCSVLVLGLYICALPCPILYGLNVVVNSAS